MSLDNLHQKRSGAPIAMATWSHADQLEYTGAAARVRGSLWEARRLAPIGPAAGGAGLDA